MSADRKESVLGRWSRRKLEAREARDAPADETPPAAAGQPGADAAPVETEPAPLLTDADMPPLDSLTEESDFSPFMSKGVSDELRNLALRKLFRSQVFNIRDGLDEYDDDFTSFEKLGDIVTADMKHRIEMEQQKLREKLAAEGDFTTAGTAEADGVEADGVESLDDDVDERDPARTAAAVAAPDGDPETPSADIAAGKRAEEKS